MNEIPVIIATRGSKLALHQAQKVKEELENCFPGQVFEIKVIKTKGDFIQDVALAKIGDRYLFSRELENLLLQKKADMAVHSLKDMPTELPEGLKIAGVLQRGEPRDALVSTKGKKLSELDENDIIATSSLRRKAQLLHFNKKLRIIDIRGNADTRVHKMEAGYCTALVMAAAGLQRLGMQDKISEILEPDIMVPAAGQGAIAIEIRKNNPEIESMVLEINHNPTLIAVQAERVFLKALEGGCQVPIGCYTESDGKKFKISGVVANLDGSITIKDSVEGEIRDAKETALILAQRFLEKRAGEIIHNIRNLNNI